MEFPGHTLPDGHPAYSAVVGVVPISGIVASEFDESQGKQKSVWLHSFLPRLLSGSSCNELFGFRRDPGANLLASNLHSPPGEVPEGHARGDRERAEYVQSDSEV